MDIFVRGVAGDTGMFTLAETDTFRLVKAKVATALGYVKEVQDRIQVKHMGELVELEDEARFNLTGIEEGDEVCVEVADDPGYKDPAAHFKKAVELTAPYHYCVNGDAASLPAPCLAVAGEVLGWPLFEAQKEQLRSFPECDDREKSCLRFPPSAIRFLNDNWEPSLESFSDKQCRRIGTGKRKVNLYLRELIIRDAGAGEMKLSGPGGDARLNDAIAARRRQHSRPARMRGGAPCNPKSPWAFNG
eukprot:TRINITY_DN2009_c0_g1_i4.p1 TRINITY_DN2009_c0_g1~~TRINITY_DN2009_c0_g1_i4.p1  ORF type:complete len:246 (+),score=23.13 TRINITY_DN2009_c0_g1_i4:48-785(+)